jgi:hypothetical protein
MRFKCSIVVIACSWEADFREGGIFGFDVFDESVLEGFALIDLE